MIRLLKLAVALGLIWSLYWYGAGYWLRQGISDWFAAQAARGWQAEYADIGTSGYPARHVTFLNSPALADPATGAAWRADWLMLDSPAIWPGRQILRFPDTAQRLSYFDRTAVVTATDMVAALRLDPGLALGLERMALTAGAWRVADAGGAVMRARALTLAMERIGQPETYRFDINADGFAPGPQLRRWLRSAASLPTDFETLEMRMTVRFDKPWDRSALEQRRPQPVAIDLAQAELQWGALRIRATGKLTVGTAGRPQGSLTLRAENWREMLAMARAAGAIPPQAVSPAERTLSLLSGLGGNPDALDVQLNLRDGFVALGPIPLGPAPRLILR